MSDDMKRTIQMPTAIRIGVVRVVDAFEKPPLSVLWHGVLAEGTVNGKEYNAEAECWEVLLTHPRLPLVEVGDTVPVYVVVFGDDYRFERV